MTDSTKELAVSIAEASRRLGISAASGYRLAQRGEIPSLLLGGRRVVPLAALEQLLATPPQPSEESAHDAR